MRRFAGITWLLSETKGLSRERRVDRRSNPRRIVMHRVIPWLAPRLEFIDFRFAAIASFSPALSLSIYLPSHLFLFLVGRVSSRYQQIGVRRFFAGLWIELFQLGPRGLEKPAHRDVNWRQVETSFEWRMKRYKWRGNWERLMASRLGMERLNSYEPLFDRDS